MSILNKNTANNIQKNIIFYKFFFFYFVFYFFSSKRVNTSWYIYWLTSNVYVLILKTILLVLLSNRFFWYDQRIGYSGRFRAFIFSYGKKCWDTSSQLSALYLLIVTTPISREYIVSNRNYNTLYAPNCIKCAY